MAEKTEKPQKQKRPEKAGRQSPGKAREAAAPVEAKPREPEPKIPARLRVKFEQEVAASLMRELKIENKMRVPRLEKITINMALNEARDNVKILDSAVEELSQIAGQKPVLTRARKAISNFKLRQGMPIGVMVTLRRERMWEFFDRLVTVALPRVRDFRGVSDKAFDARQLLAGPARAHYFSGTQPRQDRESEGPHDFNYHQRPQRFRRPDAAARARNAVSRTGGARGKGGGGRSGVGDGEEVPQNQGDPHPQVQGAPVQSMSPVRALAGFLSAFQDVPSVPA